MTKPQKPKAPDSRVCFPVGTLQVRLLSSSRRQDALLLCGTPNDRLSCCLVQRCPQRRHPSLDCKPEEGKRALPLGVAGDRARPVPRVGSETVEQRSCLSKSFIANQAVRSVPVALWAPALSLGPELRRWFHCHLSHSVSRGEHLSLPVNTGYGF